MEILIISLSGIGNTLMYTPALRLLRKKFPDAQIDVLVRKKSYGDVFDKNYDVNNVIAFERGGFIKRFFKLISLIKTKYDISIINFPSRKPMINLFSYLVHAKKRLGHSYSGFGTYLLQNQRLKADSKLHDIEQNLELLKLLGINYDKEKDTKMILKCESPYADKFFKENKLGDKDFIVGVHPGSSLDHNFALKRWGIEKFGELCNRLIDKHNAKILIFGGHDEIQLKDELNRILNGKGYITDTEIKGGASLSRKCDLFITNDSGPMHIAAAAGIRTVALFCPTNPVRTRPYGEKNIVIRRDDCNHCFGYPFSKSSARLNVRDSCLNKITAEEVYEKIKPFLK